MYGFNIATLNSGIKIYWSVGWFMRNTFPKNRKASHWYRQTVRAVSFKSCAIVRVPRKGCLHLNQPPINWETALGFGSYQAQGNDITWCDRVSYCTKPTADTDENKNKEAEVKTTVVQRLKKLWKEYWYVLFPVHAVTSVVWYGSFYYLVINGVDIPALLETLGAPESWISNLRNSQAGNFVLAYTLYKVATPLRYTVTLGGTTLSVNKLKQWGWIRPAPTAEQIKQMCKDKKEAFIGLKATYQDKMQVTKDQFLKKKTAVSRQLAEVQEDLYRSCREVGEEFKATTEDYKYIGKFMMKQIRDRNDEGQNSGRGKK